jgi:kinesin family protein 5
VTEKYIFGKEEAIAYMAKGMSHRSVGSTLTNKKSSRSHMMFIITIHQHNVYSGEAVSAKIIIADLAGSEKYVRMGIEEKFQQETKKINTSLSSLSKVIGVLSEGRRCNHIPYRDSKLTRLLQESLGGNTTTKLIINLSPSSSYQYETIMSLRFGTRAKLIKN